MESPTDPVIFISAAESYFLQAEARERYFSGDQAESLYNQGVLAAFTSVGQDGSSFITGAYKYPTGSLEQKIEAISKGAGGETLLNLDQTPKTAPFSGEEVPF